jgi:Fe2+ or Zn2+ uptake regulation protein
MTAKTRHTEGTDSDVVGLTPQRRVVLEVVKNSDEHLTANQVYDEARKLLPSISFATVYNSLRFLRDGGFIGEITFGNGASRYDRATSRHDHAICSRCGRLVDFQIPEINDLVQRAARRSRFKPESIHLTLVGRCPECREA